MRSQLAAVEASSDLCRRGGRTGLPRRCSAVTLLSLGPDPALRGEQAKKGQEQSWSTGPGVEVAGSPTAAGLGPDLLPTALSSSTRPLLLNQGLWGARGLAVGRRRQRLHSAVVSRQKHVSVEIQLTERLGGSQAPPAGSWQAVRMT